VNKNDSLKDNISRVNQKGENGIGRAFGGKKKNDKGKSRSKLKKWRINDVQQPRKKDGTTTTVGWVGEEGGQTENGKTLSKNRERGANRIILGKIVQTGRGRHQRQYKKVREAEKKGKR